MKAIVYTRLGPPEVLELLEVPEPVPAENQVLVQVQAASVNALDSRRFSSQLEGTRVPIMTRLMDGAMMKSVGKVLGADLAGRVAAVGAAVTQFQPGDEVFGVAAGSVGAFAEYACASEAGLALKPANVSFEAAAATPVAGLTALVGLRDHGRVQPGQQVLIQGASGGVGTFAVQIARVLGAEVTAVCSPHNLDQARALGAEHVIDYTKEDFTRHGLSYDLIFAVNGYHSLLDYRRALSRQGRCVVTGGSMSQVFQGMLLGPLLSAVGGRKLGFMGIAKVSQKDLVALGELLEAGKIAPYIDQSYPLGEAAQAVRYLAEGHARGKVVIRVDRSSDV